MNILVINAGSSSLKYQLFEMPEGKVLAKGLCERIGTGGHFSYKKTGGETLAMDVDIPNHDVALELALAHLTDAAHGVLRSINDIDAVGHRIAHGGEKYKQSTVIDETALAYLYSIVELNPLHGPPAICGIEGCRRLMKNIPQIGVFDTSFYGDMPDYAYIYPLPYELYEQKKIRRYGFHGTSHRYVAGRAATVMGKDLNELKIVTCHLGNGSSITAVDRGHAVDTSMGFTPQEGILMGTRCGNIDCSIIPYLMMTDHLDAEQVVDLLNKKSGLLGVSGISNDARNVFEAAAQGNPRALLAMRILTHGIKKYIGSYVAVMNGIDALVFTAGIGENDAPLRQMVCENMDFLGIRIDAERNSTIPRGEEVNISAAGAPVQTWVIPTNEEYMIALDTTKIIE